MNKTFATVEYEDSLLDAILGRIQRDLEIDHAQKTDKEQYLMLIKNEMLESYSDPVYFIENFLWCDKNPFFFSDRIQTLVPYLLFDYQIETIDTLKRCAEKGEKAFIEKSRQL